MILPSRRASCDRPAYSPAKIPDDTPEDPETDRHSSVSGRKICAAVASSYQICARSWSTHSVRRQASVIAPDRLAF